MIRKIHIFILFISAIFTNMGHATGAALDSLENYQINTATMVSSGLPTEQQFKALKSTGVKHVIDLIPGDRTDEVNLMKTLDLNYHNIQVEWKNPTLDNFNEYTKKIQEYSRLKGKTLTHCRLNWRGAVFTYLYRITHLNENEATAKSDLHDIWQPNDVWQEFINKVKAQKK